MNTEIKAAQSTANDAVDTANKALEAVPTKVSELENDAGYIDESALDGYATEDALKEVADSAITAITVNGEDVPVEDNKAEITVEASKPTYDADSETLIF